MRLKIVWAIALLLAGCGSPEANLPSATGTNPGSSETCGESVVDYGQKGVVAATTRGNYSSVAVIPGTSHQAMAYSDTAALGVKATYWNGSNFITEMVSAGTATWVKLVFLSNGKPAVFWTTGGTTVLGAFRSAAFGTSGTWTTGIIDTFTGAANRALEVAVSPLDEIAIAYLTNTTTAGRPRFIYCDAPCSSPDGFQAMSAAETIEAANVTAAEMELGVAWCKVSDSDYYPAVTYGLSTASGTRYAVCRQSNLANCLAAANWTKQTIVTTASLLGSKLYLDSSIVGDVPKAIVKAAGGLQVYQMNASTACTAAPVAFTAGPLLGGANTGSAWASLLKDSGGKWHVAANETTTNVRYFNSQTTSITGAWNAVGNVQTITLNAVNASSGNAALSNSDSKIHIAYGIASAPISLQLSSGDYSTASNSAVFSSQFPDTTGNVLMTAAPVRNIAGAISPSGRAAAAYVDFSAGAVTAGRLKYAIRSGTSATSSWTYVQIPGPTNPQFPSIAFDGNNKPWIGYFDQTINRFYLATNSSTEGTGSWSIYTFPAAPSGTYALPAANETAVAMYKSGSTYYPVMLALDATNTNTTPGLKSAMLNPSTGTWSNVRDSSPVNAFGTSDGNSLTADFDSSGNIVAAYWDITTTKIHYFHSSNGGSTWTSVYAVTAAGVGEGASIRLNPVTGYPSLAYFERANNRVYYNSCSSSPASCATGGWSGALLDSTVGVNGLSTSTAQLIGTGIGFTSSGSPVIAYSTGQAGLGSLRLCEASGSHFSCSTISQGAGGNTVGAAVVNYGVSGWGVQMNRTAAGGLAATYIGPGGWLYNYGCN